MTKAPLPKSGRLVRRFFLQLDRSQRHHRRDRVLVDQLGLAVPPEQDAEIIEPGDVALELYAIDQENGDGSFAFPDRVEKRVLQILLFFIHGLAHLFIRRWGSTAEQA